MTLQQASVTRRRLPDPVRHTLDDFRAHFDVDLALWTAAEDAPAEWLYPASEDGVRSPDRARWSVVRPVAPKDGPPLELGVGGDAVDADRIASLVLPVLERTFDFSQEVRFFTYELSERYEEINLLYSISETLGSTLRLEDAARVILGEVCDVLGGRRGSLWVHEPGEQHLRLIASVGEEGLTGPIPNAHPDAITARVFREGRPLITRREGGWTLHGVAVREQTDSFLSVPIRYTPPSGEARTVGVINAIGRRHGGRFTASDQKLLSAIASQVGAALENNRLVQESLAQERMAREMELAHHLQMKLLPSTERFEGAEVAARVEPADSVGGDFYHLFRLPGNRTGVMIGDVSGHGFPAALIMALGMSAATIYASEFGSPRKVLHHLDDALREELEGTEMYLTLFYGVLDPRQSRLVYANAGHPHAFRIDREGGASRLGAIDPPVGIAVSNEYGEAEVAVEEAELLFLFTDGLTESLGMDGPTSGAHRVLDTVGRLRERPLDVVIDALFELDTPSERAAPPDDRTALLVRV